MLDVPSRRRKPDIQCIFSVLQVTNSLFPDSRLRIPSHLFIFAFSYKSISSIVFYHLRAALMITYILSRLTIFGPPQALPFPVWQLRWATSLVCVVITLLIYYLVICDIRYKYTYWGVPISCAATELPGIFMILSCAGFENRVKLYYDVCPRTSYMAGTSCRIQIQWWRYNISGLSLHLHYNRVITPYENHCTKCL